MAGKYEFDPFDPKERETLRRFLTYGGFLLAEDTMGAKEFGFEKAFRREMSQIFPSQELKRLPLDHSVYRSFYLIETPGGRQRVNPYLEGITIDQWTFFTFSLVNVCEEHSYPLQITQVVKSAEEKAASQAKAEAKKAAKKTTPKRKPGRPKGSQNKDKQAVVLNPELLRIQAALKSLLETIGTLLSLKYIVLDGHFGNYPSAFMVRATNLHLISKLRSDAALYPAFEGEYAGTGRPTQYGQKLDVRNLDDDKYLKATSIEKNVRTQVYQGKFYNKEFAFALNVVIILKTNLRTQAQAHVILFSTDLEQDYENTIKFYSLRFQIEFNFRDAKQYWGLEDFMNIKENAVTMPPIYPCLWLISAMPCYNHFGRSIPSTAFWI